MNLDLTLHPYEVWREADADSNAAFVARFATLKGAASHALYLGQDHWVEHGSQVWNYAQCEAAMRERTA